MPTGYPSVRAFIVPVKTGQSNVRYLHTLNNESVHVWKDVVYSRSVYYYFEKTALIKRIK